MYTTVGAGVVAFGSWYQDIAGRKTLMRESILCNMSIS